MPKQSTQQLTLDFSSQYHDRIRQLSQAVSLTTGANLRHKYLLHLVLRLEKPEAGLTWPTAMIAEELMCDSRTVQRTSSFLLEHGLLEITERYASQTGERTNELRIDWEGVQRVLTRDHVARLERLGMSHAGTAVLPRVIDGNGGEPTWRGDSTEQAELLGVGVASHNSEGQGGPRQNVMGPRHFVTGPRQNVGAIKEQLAPVLAQDLTDTEPVPVLRPSPDFGEGTEESWRALPAEPGFPRLEIPLEESAEIPQLLEASRRFVAAMPDAANLVYGPFRVLTAEQLLQPDTIVRWFRRQLALRKPLTKGSEAELLVVLAAATWASKLAPDEVKRSRVAAFSSVITREGFWHRVKRYIPQAAETLESLATAKGRFWLVGGN